jgi:DNA recombination protein RmuC
MESIEASVRPLTAPEFLAIEDQNPTRKWPPPQAG